MQKHIIAGNWKMNPAHQDEAHALASNIEAGCAALGKNIEVAVCPPFPYLAAVRAAVKKVKCGAQNVFWEERGAYTGEVSPLQLKNLGVAYVILGHSERRMHLWETNEMINKKTKAALECRLSVILCIGESEREDGEIPSVVGDQLAQALSGVKKNFLKNLTVCYEPVWAISTNKNARPDTPDNAFRAGVFVRKIVTGLYDRKTADTLRVIYGGSVRKDNISAFLTEGRMQGALIGGASLDADEFIAIAALASRAK